MSAIKKYQERVKKYGRRYVWKVILRNKVYHPLNKILFRFESGFIKEEHLKDIIIIESHNDFDCNGGEIYNYLVSNEFNKKYKIIWLTKNKVPNSLPANVKAYDIWRPSFAKTYYFCSAKYLFFDDVIIDKVFGKQISIYCSHGACSIKNVKGKIVVPKSVDYILSSGENFDRYICDNFSVDYPNSRMLHTGFPSNDLLFENSNKDISKITQIKYRKSILWMPTFRKGGSSFDRADGDGEQPLGIPIIKNKEELYNLNDFLNEQECILIVKIHPMQEPLTYKILFDINLSNIFFLDGKKVKELEVDNYRIMSESSALISDYSASTYSFLMLNRPIGFAIDDINDYKIGFITDELDKFMPGQKIKSYKELRTFILDVCNDVDKYIDKRTELLNWMYENVDGNSTQRLLDFLNISIEK